MAFSHMKRRVCVLDSYISYSDTRAGEDTVIFLHGNPTSSFVWRRIVPKVQGVARCLSPDLLGFGDSGKEPRHSYRFADHYRYFCAWIDSIKVEGKYIFVCHELGSMLAFHWCSQNENKVKAIIHMESIVAPLRSYNDFGTKLAADLYKEMRHDGEAADKVLQDNHFLEACLTAINNNTNSTLSEVELAAYREPFSKPDESRMATLTGVHEIPIIGEGPNDVIAIVTSYSEWLANTDIPKLFIFARPGTLSKFGQEMTKEWKNQVTVSVTGNHVPQEECPDEIAKAIVKFIKRMESYDPNRNKDIHVLWFD